MLITRRSPNGDRIASHERKGRANYEVTLTRRGRTVTTIRSRVVHTKREAERMAIDFVAGFGGGVRKRARA